MVLIAFAGGSVGAHGAGTGDGCRALRDETFPPGPDRRRQAMIGYNRAVDVTENNLPRV